jgi:hypothetical protein
VAALDNTIYSRWMVAPSRTVAGSSGDKDERYAIATGLLGGFGGFLDVAFREHDYQLGRRNCQMFLKKVFSVVESHPFVEGWPSGVAKRFRYLDPGGTGKYYCPVIPLVGTAALEVPAPTWKRIDEPRLAEIERRIKTRAQYIVPRLIANMTPYTMINLVLRIFWFWLGKSALVKFARRSIEADLIRRDQYALTASYSAEARAVVAELTAPGYDYRTVAGLDAAIDLDEAHIRTALAELAKIPNLLWSGQVNGQECWVLTSRRPNWFDWLLKGKPRIG